MKILKSNFNKNFQNIRKLKILQTNASLKFFFKISYVQNGLRFFSTELILIFGIPLTAHNSHCTCTYLTRTLFTSPTHTHNTQKKGIDIELEGKG